MNELITASLQRYPDTHNSELMAHFIREDISWGLYRTKKLSVDRQYDCRIGSHPEPVNIDVIMYHFYVLDKIRKGGKRLSRGTRNPIGFDLRGRWEVD